MQIDQILRNKKKLRKELINQTNLLEKRILILSGSTIGHIRDVLEIFLLYDGIQPIFHEGTYGRFYEDVIFDIKTLMAFKPDFVYIHTSIKNVINVPNVCDTVSEISNKLETEFLRFKSIWVTKQL